MILHPIWQLIEDQLFPLPSAMNGERQFFNFYLDEVLRFDLPGAAGLRRQNLHSYLASYHEIPPVLVIGEAAGWHGARFSGVPFTCEALLTGGKLPFSGSQTSNQNAPCSEITAAVFWSVMKPHFPRFLAWNIFPLHPRDDSSALKITNRRPSPAEIRLTLGLLQEMVAMLKPKRLIAVGKVAYETLRDPELKLGINPQYVRHPSFGGKQEFARALQRL
jgi:uracil-DNA glycosylase